MPLSVVLKGLAAGETAGWCCSLREQQYWPWTWRGRRAVPLYGALDGAFALESLSTLLSMELAGGQACFSVRQVERLTSLFL